MPTVQVTDIHKAEKGSIELPDDIFGIKGRDAVLHSAVVSYLANKRQGTHCTKSRGDVSGGGRKPYKQKGTGRARAGSTRSPLMRGGATIFGPTPRDYRIDLPRKQRRLALSAALSARFEDGDISVVDEIRLEAPKTREVMRVLENLGLAGGSVLIVSGGLDRTLFMSARNIPGARVMPASDLNAYDVMRSRKVLMTSAAVEALKDRWEAQ